MTKRFLIVGDNQLDSKNPQSRMDNYLESCLMELRESLQIAKACKADYYILLGDVFDRIEVGGACRNRALEILMSDDGEPWTFKKYVVVGNHDIAHNPSNLEKSALETLIAAGAVERLDSIEDLSVKFLHFQPDLDEQLRNGELANYQSKIVFCHASIVDKPSRFDHVLFSDLACHPETKIIVSGHIHHPMESVNDSGVSFFNPGSLGRTKIDELHQPQVLLIQYDYDSDTFKHKYFKLKRSMSSDIIFDLDRNNKTKTENKNTELFIETITNVNLNDHISADLCEDLVVFAQKTNIEQAVIDMAKETVSIIKTGGQL